MIISYLDTSAISKALTALHNKDVFVYPTDTIYGFGGDARSDIVLEKIYELKQRPATLPVSMIVRDKEMMSRYVHLSGKAEKLIDRFLPGALTLVLPARTNDLPDRLFSVQGFLGFRIPQHDLCHAISEQFEGPIITTSVNLSGKAPLNNVNSINGQFGDKVDLIISDAKLDGSNDTSGSTVVMISGDDSVKILREAAISVREIEQAIL